VLDSIVGEGFAAKHQLAHLACMGYKDSIALGESSQLQRRGCALHDSKHQSRPAFTAIVVVRFSLHSDKQTTSASHTHHSLPTIQCCLTHVLMSTGTIHARHRCGSTRCRCARLAMTGPGPVPALNFCGARGAPKALERFACA
jgi:hypothetical protein